MNTRALNNNRGRSVTKNASNLATKALDKSKEIGQALKNTANKVTNAVKTTVGDVQKQVNGITQMNAIKGPVTKWSAMTQEFFTSNTVISKFVGFVLCLLLFVLIFQIGMGLLQNAFAGNTSPYLINGMVVSDTETQISSNPNIPYSVPIIRSNNENQGLEFSWNVWFNVTHNTSASSGTLQKIFAKGNGIVAGNAQTSYLNVCPGLYLARDTVAANPNDNKLRLVINTYVPAPASAPGAAPSSTDPYEIIDITDIPIAKWVCCTIRVQGKDVDIYINGFLKKRHTLLYLPKQNYADTYIGDKSGFKGYISSLRYYSYAVGYDEIQTLFAAGPSMKLVSTSAMPPSSDYLASNWYFT